MNFKSSWLPKFIYAIKVWEGNQYIDFKEAATGAERTATIDAGYYLPEDFANAVASAMDAAPSASGDYTVSFSRSTDKFTISTDLTYLDLLWNTGTNAASGAATALGYAAVDATGATAYEADNVLPNRFISTQPIRSPRPAFKPERKRTISDSGVQVTNYRRIDQMYGFQMLYIEEQELNNNWLEMISKNGTPLGYPVDYYPDGTDTADYLRAFIDDAQFRPAEMVDVGFTGHYRFNIMLRQKLPKAGTIEVFDLFPRTV